MSWASHFIFDPIKAAVARAATSSNPVAQQTAAAATTAIAKIDTDTSSSALSSNSAAGVVSTVIGDLENGLNEVVSTFAAAVAGDIPLVGGFIAPKVHDQAMVALAFAEQHAMTYIAALFSHHRAAVVTAAEPVPPAT